jgi:hypothetical protein
MSAFAAQQSIAFRANVSAKTVSSSKRQSKKIVRSLRVEAAKKSVGDLSKGDLEGARSFFKRDEEEKDALEFAFLFVDARSRFIAVSSFSRANSPFI